MKSSMPYRGLTSPELRALLRPLLADPALAPASRAEWEADVRALWDHATHREERYAALAVTGHRAARPWQDPAALGLYRHLVETGAWWDYVDLVAADRVGPILLRHRPIVTPMMRADAVDAHLWVRRTAILAQLKHREETDLDAAGRRHRRQPRGVAASGGSSSSARRSAGRCASTRASTPTGCRAFVESRGDRLSGLSRREALKHL